ncbi:hypothetical protein DFJ43DRAFT_894153 [Lentinula guzmanii]|uniref:Uncharacterized protein n=1 Tax=Lentinula guzmanii TaxID=2804957 RepID=A0AA38JEW5_9AGAR|nr:hypothetical protein DFJ43DRAFT_894153 [Lentinula guzmanii]
MPILPPASLPDKCTCCRGNADSGFKTCTACRKKRNAYQKQRNRKKRAKDILSSYDLDIEKKREKTLLNDTMIFGTEFQSATEMYRQLKSLVRMNARLNYKACHSIVADPECGHKKRALLVARDVRKVAHVPFNHKGAPAHPSQSLSFHTLQFRCTCMTSDSSQRVVGKQANYLGNGDAENGTCQGEVEVTVLDDLRHPSGIAARFLYHHLFFRPEYNSPRICRTQWRGY